MDEVKFNDESPCANASQPLTRRLLIGLTRDKFPRHGLLVGPLLFERLFNSWSLDHRSDRIFIASLDSTLKLLGNANRPRSQRNERCNSSHRDGADQQHSQREA
jgi:hypothetical protein